MKSIRKILCSIICLLLICNIFVGCIDNNGDLPPETETTITLDEARVMVNTSLEDVDDIPTTLKFNKLHNNLPSKPNRNLFVKLVNSEFTFVGDENGSNVITGYVQKKGDNWTKYNLVNGDYMGYYDGEYEYSKTGENYTKNQWDSTYFGLVMQSLDCMYVDLLFIDSAWINIYNNTATKTPIPSGYKITMDVNMSKYVDFVMSECEARNLPTEGLFGDGIARQMNKDDGSVSLVLNFDNRLNITGLELVINSYYFAGPIVAAKFLESKITIKKYNQNVTAPAWFDINNYS